MVCNYFIGCLGVFACLDGDRIKPSGFVTYCIPILWCALSHQRVHPFALLSIYFRLNPVVCVAQHKYTLFSVVFSRISDLFIHGYLYDNKHCNSDDNYFEYIALYSDDAMLVLPNL